MQFLYGNETRYTHTLFFNYVRALCNINPPPPRCAVYLQDFWSGPIYDW
jgi:hypothetical protein